MRIFFLLIMNLCCLCFLIAQTTVDVVRYREVLRSAEKRSLIGRAMELSVVEASVFWPIYESYDGSRRRLSASYAIRIDEYVHDYPSMTEKKSHRYARDFLLYEKQLSQLHVLYYKRLRHAIGSSKANKFIQMEIRIQNAFTDDMQAHMPFIGEVKMYAISSGKDE